MEPVKLHADTVIDTVPCLHACSAILAKIRDTCKQDAYSIELDGAKCDVKPSLQFFCRMNTPGKFLTHVTIRSIPCETPVMYGCVGN